MTCIVLWLATGLVDRSLLLPSIPKNSTMSRISHPGRHCLNQPCELIDDWAPVSQRASVSSPFRKHFTVHCACSFGDKWLTKIPGICLSSLHVCFSKEDMAWKCLVLLVFLLAFPWTISSSFTIIKELERGGTFFASTELAEMVGRIHPGYILPHWCNLCLFPDALLHPLEKLSVEPHLKQWPQLSAPAVLHELHCRRRNIVRLRDR